MLNGFNGENGGYRAGSNQTGDESEVIAYLAQMGLEDSDLSKVVSLLHAIRAQEWSQPAAGEDLLQTMAGDELLDTMQGEDLLLEPHNATVNTDTVRPRRAQAEVPAA